MKIKEQTRRLTAGCSKHCFEVVDETDNCFEVVDRTDVVRRDFRRVLPHQICKYHEPSLDIVTNIKKS
ncbi:hypothetical protein [Streptococcus pneumoniae]|uniref:hypothetical protein n=1 Tax=Streptococcus pneumoniae TaxID=1313 RepID=UPI001CD31402|nr:hypothetical protein [Streptococcus pneumoniae]